MQTTPIQQDLEALRRSYDDQGYAVLPTFLEESELAELRRSLAEVVAEADDLPDPNPRFAYSYSLGSPKQRYVKRVFDPIERHEVFRQLVFHSRILDVVEAIVGPDITLQQTKLNLKPPSTGAEFDWHQDFPFFPHTNYDIVAVMVFLDAADPDNGCLKVIPGSHRLGPLPHRFSADGQAYGTVVEDASVYSDESRWVDLALPAGSIGLHHCCTLHSSGPNMTDRGRSVFIAEYKATDARQIGGATDPAGWGTQVRGEDRRQVRMVESSFLLPDRVHLIGERA